jgi:hypothetical protein
MVVLRRCEQDAVGLPDRCFESGDGRRIALGLNVTVVKGNLLQAEGPYLEPFGDELLGGPQQPCVERALAEAPRDPEHAEATKIPFSITTAHDQLLSGMNKCLTGLLSAPATAIRALERELP